MKNWMEKIKKHMALDTGLEHDKQGLFIPNRQVSWLVVIFFGCACIFFMLGYFWGHKRAIDRFVAKLEEESFADRINYALYTMNDRESSEFEDEESTTTNGADDTQEPAQEQEEVTEVEEITVEQVAQSAKPQLIEQKLFFAPLAGFGTLQKAQAFAQKVKGIDPHVLVETRTSKNAKGRTITWYQAITGEFTSKEELEKVLTRLRKEAHIKNEIKINEKRKG